MIKKTYYDENGNPCKHWQIPEAKAKAKDRNKTPKYKAKAKATKEKPEYKAKEKARRQTPEVKAREKAIRQSPEGKAKRKAWRESPEGRRYYAAQSALRRAIKLQRSRLLTEAGKKL